MVSQSEALPTRVGAYFSDKVAARKLDVLDYAAALSDLAVPPGNRPETLEGDFVGFYSIRINDQWRVIFRWTAEGPTDVDIVDYH